MYTLQKYIFFSLLTVCLHLNAMERKEPWQLMPAELKASTLAHVQPSEKLEAALKQWLALKCVSKEWKDLISDEFTQKAWAKNYNERYPQKVYQSFYKALKDNVPFALFLLKAKAIDPNCAFIRGPAELGSLQEGACISLPEEIDIDFGRIEDLPFSYKEETPLLIAAENNSIPLMQELIRAGADVNLEIKSRLTCLLEAKAQEISDPTLQEKWKKLLTLECGQPKGPVLSHIFYRANDATIEQLLQSSAQVSAKDTVHTLVTGNQLSTVKLLLDYGLPIDAQDKAQSATLLMTAAQYGLVDMVKLLLEYGADVKLTDCHDRTVLDRAWQGLLFSANRVSGTIQRTQSELERDYEEIIALVDKTHGKKRKQREEE